ncbi:MAG: Coenzyme F420 hydrogenase/dehydrogenase, beta subunit C-terminal domain [Rickettsiales bacterium]|nr:Coenzyme F420 hydrogenase/dehydrogenase, beta subunit C-terminal domain [Rickettsiales bacterium]
MKNTIDTIANVGEKCFGCGACSQLCPKNAIAMEYSSEGFLQPAIDEAKCVNCGVCLKSCPAGSEAFRPKTEMPKCFAAYADDRTAMESSSGGLFSVLAESLLDAGGYVCGAAFDRDWLVAHRVVADKGELDALKTSKYLQSDTKRVYSEIRELLERQKSVLFSGTPCQVAGLYSFLGKDYASLLTIDVFCHGVPSPKVWEKYIREITNAGEIKSVNFRDKSSTYAEGGIPPVSAGWKDYFLTLRGREIKVLSQHHRENIFMCGFLQNLYLRKSCATCPFTKTPRTSDISLGDFWGYGCVDRKRDTGKGMSAVLLNSPKGERFFAGLEERLSFLRPVKLKAIIRGNPILREPCKTHKNRDSFMHGFANLAGDGISDLIAKYLGLPDEKAVGLMNFASWIHFNFGAILVGYAMEQAVRKVGYSPSTINFIPKHELFDATGASVFSSFRRKFMNLTGICTDKAGLSQYINERFNKLCIGADQVIRNCGFDFVYYLDWAHGKKSLISYAPSFGTAELGMTDSQREYAKQCLHRFDAFSIREHSGAKIMERDFGIDAKVLCDPTMLLSGADYQPIIDAEAVVRLPPEYVAYYLLDESVDVLDEIKKHYPIINAYRDEGGDYRTVGDWLNIIKNAKYVITDSFHGGVFSIIYQKQFIVLPTAGRGNERIETLMLQLGQNRFIADGRKITEDLFRDPIDYAKVAPTMARMQADGFAYLQNALAIEPNYKKSLVNMTAKWIKLFSILPLLKIKRKDNKTRVRLFGIIPLLKIKDKKVYLFELSWLRIAKIWGF